MGHMAIWKTLEEMVVELRKKDIEIPANVMNDLRAAKSMILIGASEGSRGEAMAKVEEILGSVEASLVTEAQRVFGNAVVDAWLRRIEAAGCPSCEPLEVEEAEEEDKFITGVPRDQKWIRVEPDDFLTTEKMKLLAQEHNLQIKTENNGKLTIYGSQENIKQFIKKMAAESAK